MIVFRQDKEDLLEFKKKADEEVSTLRRVVQNHEQESKHRQSQFENKLAELQSKGLSPTEQVPLINTGKHGCFLLYCEIILKIKLVYYIATSSYFGLIFRQIYGFGCLLQLKKLYFYQ